MPTVETKTYTITATTDTLRKFEGFLALLHFNTGWGHSNLFAMPCDGDGHEHFRVDPEPDKHWRKKASKIGGTGATVEIAQERSYLGRFIDYSRKAYVSE